MSFSSSSSVCLLSQRMFREESRKTITRDRKETVERVDDEEEKKEFVEYEVRSVEKLFL